MTKKDLGLLVLIIVVGAVVTFANPRFLSPVNFANTANVIGMFGISALGQAFVILTGGIELSVGSVIALTGVLFVDFIANQGVPWPIALVLMLVPGAVIGLFHGLLITRLKMQPFIVTLCGLLFYRGIARFYTGDSTAGFGFGQSFPDLEFLAAGRSFGVPNTFIAMLVIAAIIWVVMHRSIFGRYLYAVGKNEEAARYSGIKTDPRHRRGLRDLPGAHGDLVRCTSPCTRARSRPPRTAISMSSTRSRRRCSAASRCAAAKARSSARSLASCCCRSCRTSST